MAAPSDAVTLSSLWTVVLSLLGSGVVSAIISAIAGGRVARKQTDATIEGARLAAEATVRSALSAAGSDSRRLQYELMRRRLEMFDSACLSFLTATRDPKNISSDHLAELDEIGGAAMLVCGPQWNQISPKWATFFRCAAAWLKSFNRDMGAFLEAQRVEIERLKQGQPASDKDWENADVSDETARALTAARSALFELCSSVDNIAMDRLARASGPNGSA